ncbi:MAG TPA: TIGR02611 family protein [Microbacterium sp.]|nr:TIGR02611 family protein [Microbacterium sp.]
MSNDAIQVVSIPPQPETADDADRPNVFVRGFRAVRRAIGRNRLVEVSYQAVVGTIGGVLAIGGLVLVPLPGPGWLVVFAGLALLATEFGWAKRLAHWLKRQLDRFWGWWRARRARRAATRAARA